jgi:hypothetical protein
MALVIMGLTFQQKDRYRSRTDIIINDPKTKLKKRRMVRADAFRQILSSLLVLGSIAFVVYCSSLYFGAFVDVGEVVGSSQTIRAEKAKASIRQVPRIRQNSFISPISDYLATDRLYIRRGQSVLATYSLPKSSKLYLSIQQCKTIPVIEIFKCTPVGEQSKSISNKTTGFVEFSASRPGFYHFQDRAVKLSRKQLIANTDYRVSWQRGGK